MLLPAHGPAQVDGGSRAGSLLASTEMRRRLALLFIPLVAGLLLLKPHVPASRPLQLHFGTRGALVREVDFHFQRQESVVRDLVLNFPGPAGAPADLERTVKLADGDYEVGIRLVYAGGDERHITRSIRAGGNDAKEAVEIDLDVK